MLDNLVQNTSISKPLGTVCRTMATYPNHKTKSILHSSIAIIAIYSLGVWDTYVALMASCILSPIEDNMKLSLCRSLWKH